MKQERRIESLKNEIFELFINGNDSEIDLAKKLGRIINAYESGTKNKSIESGSNPFI